MKCFVIFLFLTLLLSCKKEVAELENVNSEILSFVVAGHVYGNSDTYTESVYPPFLKKMHYYGRKRKVDYLFLTGDVVAHPTEENWKTVKEELDALNTPYFIARGNHDVGDYMNENIQKDAYFHLRKGNALLFILNTCNQGWAIDSAQRTYIESSLVSEENVENIFVFSHQLWWIKNPPAVMEIDSIRPNSFALWDGETSFWETGFYAFEAENKPTYFFAGDMGCYFGLAGYYEDHYENYHFYGSGMGGAVEDNFLFVQVFEDSSVKITRVDF